MSLRAFPCPYCGHPKTLVICGYRGRGEIKRHHKARYRRCVCCEKKFRTMQVLKPEIGEEELSEYVDQKAYRQGLLLRGDWPSCKLKPEQVVEIRKQWFAAEYQDDQLAIEIARDYGVKPRAIWNIARGISWKALLDRSPAVAAGER